MATTYYVSTTGNNANPGTIGSPFLRISYGVAALSAGDTLLIRGGTYTDTADRIDSVTYTVPSGTDYSSGVITIAAYPSETVIIQPPDGVNGVRLQTGAPHHIIFQDLIFDGSSQTTPAHLGGPSNVYLAGTCHHIKFVDCASRYGAADGYEFGTGGAGVADSIEIIGGSIHGNGRLNYGNSGYGVYWKGSNHRISGADIYSNNGYGVHFNAAAVGSNNVITGNRIYSNTVHGAPTVGGTTSYGIALINAASTLIKNNLIYANQGGVLVYNGSTGTKIYNNTITGNVGHSGGGEYAVQMQFHGTGTVIRNNIIYNNANGAIRDDGDASGAFGTYTADHNLTTDPGFVDAGSANYHLAAPSGAAYDTGMTLADVTDDFDAVARPQGGSYDIGAYEFNVGGGGGGGGVVPPPSSSIAVDNHSTGSWHSSGGTQSFGFFTVGAAGKLLLVYMEDNGGSGTTTAVSYGGFSLTQVIEAPIAGYVSGYGSVWALESPPTGSNEIIATTSGSAPHCLPISFSGFVLGSTIDSIYTAAPSTNAFNATGTASSADRIRLSFIRVGNYPETVSTGSLVTLVDTHVLGTTFAYTKAITAAGTDTIAWTGSTTSNYTSIDIFMSGTPIMRESLLTVEIASTAVDAEEDNFSEEPPLGADDGVLAVNEGLPGLLSWVEWQRRDVDVAAYVGDGVDASTYTLRTSLYSDQDMQCPSTFYGGFKEARVETFGDFERLASDQRKGTWRGSTGRLRFSDYDRSIRTRADDPIAKWWATSVIAVRIISRELRALLGQALTVMVAQLRSAKPDPPLSYEIELQDYVASLLTDPGFRIPQRVTNGGVLGIDLVSAALQHPVPIIYGKHERATGAMKPVYLGTDGTDHWFLVAGHPCCGGVRAIYVDGVETTTDGGWTVPGHSQPYFETLNDEDFVIIRGTVGNAVVEDCASGSKTLTADVWGWDDRGDGTGACITQVRLQYKHFCIHYLGYIDGYMTGGTQDNPVWSLLDRDVPIVDTTSFNNRNGAAAARYPGGYIGKVIFGATKSDHVLGRDAIARFNQSSDLTFATRRFGQIFVFDTIPTAADLAAAPLFTDTDDIIKDSFSIDVKWDEQANRIPYRADYNYATGQFEAQDRDAEDTATIAYYGKTVVGDFRDYYFVPDSDQGKNVAEYEIARVKHPPRYVSFKTALGRLTNMELGDYVRVQHFAGVGPNEERLLVLTRHCINPGERTVAVTGIDVTDLVDFVV